MGMLEDVLGQAGGIAAFVQKNPKLLEAAGSLRPALINQFTPKGELPQSASLESALGSLLKSVIR